ncbi:TolC family protein [Luteolibacter pohnpeiensis]|uniref:TolC family protein n=1 Tax=Luteolibacter pohnpeiensis TaxID=454153 RepID=A0A934S6N9_9BACT|nr:TolC family protein [Luteolibacter pohnpeiensis]MBK1883217.1 TolC family protein [Luteolibacter pohnpeiensis]
MKKANFGLYGLWALMALCAVSCQSYHELSLEPKALLEGYDGKSLAAPAVDVALESGHYRRSGSWNIGKLETAAEVTMPTILRAKAELELAKSDLVLASASPPIGVSMDLQRALSGLDPWTVGFSLDYTFETAGKKGLRQITATRRIDEAALAVSKTRLDVRKAIALAYVNHLGAAERSAALSRESSLLQEWQSALEKQEKLGETDRLEQFTLSRERAVLDRDLLEAKKLGRTSNAELGKSVGVPSSEMRAIALEPLPDHLPPAPELQKLQQLAALSRPDVLEKLASYALSEADLRLEIANQYPDVHLGPGFSFDQGQRKWLLAPSASILPDLNRAGIAKAEAARKVAWAVFLETQTTALGEVAIAWEEYRGSLFQLENAIKIAGKSTELCKAKSVLLDAGEGDLLSVLQARYLESQDKAWVAVARFDAWRALAELEAASGVKLIK